MEEENNEHEENIEDSVTSEEHVETPVEDSVPAEEPVEKKKFSIKEFYDKNYKKLLIIPILLLVLAIAQIGFQFASTGDFMSKGVSLKGGLTVSIDRVVNINELNRYLNDQFSESDINVRALSRAGTQVGVIVETSDIDADELINVLKQGIKDLKEEEYNVELMGSSLGASFFKETVKSLYVAFLFMGLVVFLYFGEQLKYKIAAGLLTLTAALFVMAFNLLVLDIIAYILGVVLVILYILNSIPSIAVILAAVSDIIITLAIVNIVGIKLSTAGIAAFLMLIGYSVDTDILLTTKVLKRKEGTILSGILRAMKTGMMMNLTTVIAIIIALFFTQSEVLRQIMTIVLIGLLVDLPNTWIQNAGILRWYLEKKHGQS